MALGLGLTIVWNMIGLWFDRTGSTGWITLLLLLPGLVSWLGAVAAPRLVSRLRPRYERWYRLTYDASSGWSDDKARAALLNLIRTGTGLDLLWAAEGDGSACWFGVAAGGEVVQRLVGDLFPAGSLEAGQPPAPGTGVVRLCWQTAAGRSMPTPAELCRLEGVDGVYFRWRSEQSATVALWGPRAEAAARQFGGGVDLLPGQGDSLLYPAFAGDNPWPVWPAFPASRDNPGLAAVSPLERLAPGLRLNPNTPALVLGLDAEGQPVGFALPELAGVQPLQIVGQAAGRVASHLADQAIRLGLPVAVLDGQGTVTAHLARRLMREMAAGQVLLCDVQRPAQSRFRLNPLWLPARAETWPTILAGGWPAWLRDLGVTPAGLGQAAYRHTQVAVMVTALLEAERGRALDIPGLYGALAAPDFLALLGEELPAGPIVGEAVWAWWLAEGRTTPNFDVHLRLGHLRERLKTLLERPEYSVLWRPPYLDPLAALTGGGSLMWRLIDPRRQLQPYLASQLLALTTLLSVWPAAQPPLTIFLHELEAGEWAPRLSAFPTARLILSARRVPAQIVAADSASLLVSRLAPDDAVTIQSRWSGLSAADLRRLPPRRLVLQHGQELGTLDLLE
jgi:hypothetical protein